MAAAIDWADVLRKTWGRRPLHKVMCWAGSPGLGADLPFLMSPESLISPFSSTHSGIHLLAHSILTNSNLWNARVTPSRCTLLRSIRCINVSYITTPYRSAPSGPPYHDLEAPLSIASSKKARHCIIDSTLRLPGKQHSNGNSSVNLKTKTCPTSTAIQFLRPCLLLDMVEQTTFPA